VEIRLRSFFLGTSFLIALMSVTAVSAQSDEDEQTNLIEPQIERIDFDESMIDSDDFEIAAYVGYLAVEDFDTDVVIGFKLGYNVSEEFFVQLSYGESDTGETSYEKLSGGAPLLSDDERELKYYLMSVGYNLFPGEAFLTDSTTFNTVLYLSAGVGNTEFAGDDRFTTALAVGHRTLFADGFSFDIEMRDLIFEQDLFGEEETTHNIEMTFALNVFF
jgi:outer membrane beta-barrel protein